MKIGTVNESKVSSYEGLRILITGGAGFVGSHLTKATIQFGGHVSVLDNFNTGIMANLDGVAVSADIIKGDVRDPKALKEAVKDKDIVFHLAANASVPNSVDEVAYDFDVNARGTLNLLKAVLETNSDATVIYASTASVYGEPERLPIDEESPLKPISPYGASKLAGETYCRVFHLTYGIPYIALRYFNIYGPYQPRYVIRDFLDKLRRDNRRLEVLGSGEQVRDFIYISDAIRATVLLSLNPAAVGGCFNIGTGRGTKIRDLAETVVDLLGLKGRTEIAFTGESWRSDVQRWVADITKIEKLGFRPTFTLPAGIKTFIDWYSSQPAEKLPQPNP